MQMYSIVSACIQIFFFNLLWKQNISGKKFHKDGAISGNFQERLNDC